MLIAAPASASGKTVITLALLRHFRQAGRTVASVKTGPDYIDPAFHAVASGKPCLNLDSWAMRRETLADLLAQAAQTAELILGEGVMGLFDGAPDGAGSTAELAELTGWPVVLVIDAAGMAASAAALLHGFATYRPEVPLAAVIFNRVGGETHARLLLEACGPLEIPVLGAVPRLDALVLPDRHLGLVQAAEHPDLEAFLDAAAGLVAQHLDTDALARLARPTRLAPAEAGPSVPPLGRRIAVAHDTAFAFAYPFVLDGWRRAGAEISCFSPLANEGPDPAADAVYLPGGYPELHAGRLSAGRRFLDGLRRAAARGATVYGECGGYMVLGDGLEDSAGLRHRMAGLLPLETSFAEPRLTLGYREAALTADGPLGPAGARFRGHEFHFARVLRAEAGTPLFQVRDARGLDIGSGGLRAGLVMGSFLHLVDRAGGAGRSIPA
jgi:cobyrinic acid a,c-diamide synthase